MERETKYIISTIIYFIFLLTIVTIVTAISTEFDLDTGFNSTGGSQWVTNSTGYADGFRFFGLGDFGHTHDFLNRDKTPRPYLQLGFIEDNDSCLAFEGFEWDKPTFWGIPYGDPTCKGKLDFTYYDPNSTFNDGLAIGRYTIDEICTLPLLDTSEDLTRQFQCQWFIGNPTDDTESGSTGFLALWESIKDIATLNIEFPIENSFLNFLVNFIIIGIPAIWLGMLIAIVVRKFVGFT